MLVYILCPDPAAEALATMEYSRFPWAKVIMIPTTYYLESIMYSHILSLREDEWEHEDFVGCMSWRASTKINVFDDIESYTTRGAEFVALMYRGDPLVDAADMYHPGFKRVWVSALGKMGLDSSAVTHPDLPSFYCNYWLATPAIMKEYIQFFKRFRKALESLDPPERDILWSDSKYKGALPVEKRLKIWGTRWYPFHPFLSERLPCLFVALRTPAISCLFSSGIKSPCTVDCERPE